MGVFDIDYDRLAWQSMPVRLRKNVHFAWLKCLIEPVKYLFGIFKTNRTANLYSLAHNSQVCYLEAVLNDTFDPSNRRIFISDPSYTDPIYIYKNIEAKPVFIDLITEIGTHVIPAPDPIPLYTEGETLFMAPSFIINVPMVVPFDTDRMKAVVDVYKLPGRNVYSIITF